MGAVLALSQPPAFSRSQPAPPPPPLTWDPSALGDQVWLAWHGEDLAPGPVSSWKDRTGHVEAKQSESHRRPICLSSHEVLFDVGPVGLNLPAQGNAYLAHRSIAMVFRIDLASAHHNDGCLISFNGIDGGSRSRQPAVLYQRTPTGGFELVVHWRDQTGANAAVLPIKEGFSEWHCLVSRRYEGRHFASLDGGTEVEVGADICLFRGGDAPGIFGDIRQPALRWALDTLLVMQGQLARADVDRIMGWAFWRKHSAERLPTNHPYKGSPPAAKDSASSPLYIESTTAQWQAIQAYWRHSDLARTLEQAYRSPLDLSGYQLVFEDHFTQFTIGDEATGKGPWWSPVHPAATGSARTARVTDAPPPFSQSGSELTVRMQQTSEGWSSGVFSSVNLNGHGNAWKYGYFEFKARATRGNGFGAWPAFWVKSVNEFFMLTESRLEIDLYEGYASDPDGHHQSYHNWPAVRLLSGRLHQHRHVSNYTGLKLQEWSTDDLFDDRTHTYGLMIDPLWVKFYFDGRELSRFPTPVEARQKVFILVDLAMLPKESGQAAGAYELKLDYIRVYQLPGYGGT